MSHPTRSFVRSARSLVAALGLFGPLALTTCDGQDGTNGDVEDAREDGDTLFGEVGDTGALLDIDTGEALDAPDGDAEGPCPGCFGAPCEEPGGLQQRLLRAHPNDDSGLVCTKTCQDECPSGWSCRALSNGSADIAFVCVYNHTVYCAPCDSAADCVDPLAPSDDVRCVDGGDGGGSFCASPCDADADCRPTRAAATSMGRVCAGRDRWKGRPPACAGARCGRGNGSRRPHVW